MYVDVSDFRAYAESAGATVPSDDDDCEALLVQASRVIDSKEPRLIGSRTDRDQAYAYPRRKLVINGFEYGDQEIPDIVKRTQMQLALDLHVGKVKIGVDDSEVFVSKKRVEGVVDVGYSERRTPAAPSIFSGTLSETLLNQLMRPKPRFIVRLNRA
jgi:hypothetical protein